MAVPLASWCALRFGEMIELRRGEGAKYAAAVWFARSSPPAKGAGSAPQAWLRDLHRLWRGVDPN